MKVVVYSKPSCVQCTAVYRWLDKNGVAYETVNLPDHEVKLEEFKALGMAQAPVVEIGDHPAFSGFNPLLLEKYLLGIERTETRLYGPTGL